MIIKIILIVVSLVILILSTTFLILNLFQTKKNNCSVYYSQVNGYTLNVATIIFSIIGIIGLILWSGFYWFLFSSIPFFFCLLFEWIFFQTRIIISSDSVTKYKGFKRKTFSFDSFEIRFKGIIYEAVDRKWKTLFYFSNGMTNFDLLLLKYGNYYKENNLCHHYRKSTLIRRSKIDLYLSEIMLIFPLFCFLLWSFAAWPIDKYAFILLIINIIPICFSFYFFATHFFNKFEIKGGYLYIHTLFKPVRKFNITSIDMTCGSITLFKIKNKKTGKRICFVNIILWDDPESLYDKVKQLNPINYIELSEMFKSKKDFTFLNIDDCFYSIHFNDSGFNAYKYKEEGDPKEDLSHFTFSNDFLYSIEVHENNYVKHKKYF